MTTFIRNTRFALAALTLAGVLASTFSADAAVVCKRVGYPKGCVAATPVRGPVVYCKRVGYPKGCVVR